MDKHELTEQEIRTRFITPAIQKAGWMPTQIREEYHFTDGRFHVRGQTAIRGKPRKIDYLLEYKPNMPLAIVEAKGWQKGVGGGMQQGLDYAEGLQTAVNLDVPFVYSSNGERFLEHDRTATSGIVEREIGLDEFPSPAELWQRYQKSQAVETAVLPLITQDYHYERGGKTPRYYQRIAINRTVNAIAKEQRRVLLVMATGTGKTFVASQIIWRLWKAGWAKRILFLADRNILVDQAQNNDFKAFADVMTKITNRTIDKAYEFYLALYQAISGTDESKNIYKQFSPDFFDLIVVDECHRGSAAEDSAWREILEYFAPAAQLGLTATPKETETVSNSDYFGEPLYTYSLKQGIDDGFLAPYSVIRIHLDTDMDGWRPDAGQVDKYGNEIADKLYTQDDMERTLIIEERTKLVASRITEFLREQDRMAKTIVFCVDIDHAERMRSALVNENGDKVTEDGRYVMRITGDSEEGKGQLDNFIAPDEPYPVIATTSKLMTTGVDAKTCKLIVLDRRINSMTEFKQIIGRGTRIDEEYGKTHFTIMDFRDATRLFSDPEFDGDPVQVVEFGQRDEIGAYVRQQQEWDDKRDKLQREPRPKYVVADVPVAIRHEQQQFLTADGRLITEKFVACSRSSVRQVYQSLDEFLQQWSAADRKTVILAELLEHGVWLDKLEETFGSEFDPFDLICHVAFDTPTLTRKQRAERVQLQQAFAEYGEAAQKVLAGLLAKYADGGIGELDRARDPKTMVDFLQMLPFREVGRPIQIMREFGGQPQFMAAVQQLSQQIYAVAV